MTLPANMTYQAESLVVRSQKSVALQVWARRLLRMSPLGICAASFSPANWLMLYSHVSLQVAATAMRSGGSVVWVGKRFVSEDQRKQRHF